MKSTLRAFFAPPGIRAPFAGWLGGDAAPAAELWVAPNGDDANPGTKENPLASPAIALRKARDLRRTNSPAVQEGVHIVLKGGIYPLTTPLTIRPEDSGTATSLTIIQAAPGEQPIISGGAPITNWRKLEAKPFPDCLDARKGNVWVAEAPKFNGHVLEFRQLWVKDQKAVRARTPNGDTCEPPLPPGIPNRKRLHFPPPLVASLKAPRLIPLRPVADRTGAATTMGDRQPPPERFRRAACSACRSLVAPAADQIGLTFQQPESKLEFEHPWPQPILPPKGGGAFYLVNSLDFLDEPGEWYEEMPGGPHLLLAATRRRYDQRCRRSLPALETLVQVTRHARTPVSFVSFKGIGFAHTAWMRPSEQGHVPLQAGMAMTESYKLRPRRNAECLAASTIRIGSSACLRR